MMDYREADPSESLKDLMKRDDSRKVADMLLTKSAKLWKMGRENESFREDTITLPAATPLTTEEEDEDEDGWNQMSKIVILYGKNSQP